MARRSLKIRIAALALAGTVLFGTAGAAAQPIACSSRGEIVAWLEERFSEKPVGFGLVGSQTLVEIHISPAGTWTILTTDVHGRSCMIAAGHS